MGAQVSPEDLLQAARVLEEEGLPLHLHTFSSGVMVLRSQGVRGMGEGGWGDKEGWIRRG